MKNFGPWTLAGGLLLVAVAALLVFFARTPEIGVWGEVHEHADLKLYLNGVSYNFSQARYTWLEKNGSKTPNELVHFHDGDGEVLHKHARGVTLGVFFESLKIRFSATCFVLDSGESFCNDETRGKKIKLFVNGKQNFDFENYESKNLDRILISFGNENSEQIRQQIASVSDKACIQSGSCPERGKPSDESSCTTQAGCAPE